MTRKGVQVSKTAELLERMDRIEANIEHLRSALSDLLEALVILAGCVESLGVGADPPATKPN
jgi:hypothetical protein